MDFEFDLNKSKLNLEKHGISLEDCKVLWEVFSVEVDAVSTEEPRSMIIGKIKDKLYSCIFTVRGEKIRLISTRRSHRREEDIYHEHIHTKKNEG